MLISVRKLYTLQLKYLSTNKPISPINNISDLVSVIEKLVQVLNQIVHDQINQGAEYSVTS